MKRILKELSLKALIAQEPCGLLVKHMLFHEISQNEISLDTKELMEIRNIMDSAEELERLLKANELEGYYINQNPYGEVKLSDYELYPSLNDTQQRDGRDNAINDRDFINQILMILNYSDGEYLLSWIGDRLGRNDYAQAYKTFGWKFIVR